MPNDIPQNIQPVRMTPGTQHDFNLGNVLLGIARFSPYYQLGQLAGRGIHSFMNRDRGTENAPAQQQTPDVPFANNGNKNTQTPPPTVFPNAPMNSAPQQMQQNLPIPSVSPTGNSNANAPSLMQLLTTASQQLPSYNPGPMGASGARASYSAMHAGLGGTGVGNSAPANKNSHRDPPPDPNQKT